MRRKSYDSMQTPLVAVICVFASFLCQSSPGDMCLSSLYLVFDFWIGQHLLCCDRDLHGGYMYGESFLLVTYNNIHCGIDD